MRFLETVDKGASFFRKPPPELISRSFSILYKYMLIDEWNQVLCSLFTCCVHELCLCSLSWYQSSCEVESCVRPRGVYKEVRYRCRGAASCELCRYRSRYYVFLRWGVADRQKRVGDLFFFGLVYTKQVVELSFPV